MSLTSVETLPDGRRCMVTGGAVAQETARRLQQGDGLLGWEGDPNMEVWANLETSPVTYDVWTLDAEGKPMMAIGARPYCDQRLIEDVLKHDSRRFDVVGRIIAANETLEREARARFREQMAEAHDKLHFALVHDVGHQYYGMSRRQWGFGDHG